MRRNDDIYFCIKRGGELQNVDDLEWDERAEVISEYLTRSAPDKRAAWLKSLANVLADQLYDMGEQLGVVCE